MKHKLIQVNDVNQTITYNIYKNNINHDDDKKKHTQ